MVLEAAVQEGVSRESLIRENAFEQQTDGTRRVEREVGRDLTEVGDTVEVLTHTAITSDATSSESSVARLFQSLSAALRTETQIRRIAATITAAGRLIREYGRYTGGEVTLGELLGWIVIQVTDEVIPWIRAWVHQGGLVSQFSFVCLHVGIL